MQLAWRAIASEYTKIFLRGDHEALIRIRWHVEVSHRWINFCLYLVAGRVGGSSWVFCREGTKGQLAEISSGYYQLSELPVCCGSRTSGKGRWAWNTGEDLHRGEKLHDVCLCSLLPPSHFGVPFRKQSTADRRELEMLGTKIWRFWRQKSLMKDLHGLGCEEKESGKQQKTVWFSHTVCFQCRLQVSLAASKN